VNPYEPYHDQALEVRMCHPNPRAKSFALVRPDWQLLFLDAGGNARAAEIVRTTTKKPYLGVVVTGQRYKDEIRVDTISVAH
jgi:hypothetical protein